MAAAPEFWLYLPQMRLTMDQMAERARAAETAGFAGMAGMDHLAPPLAEQQPMFEAMVTNTWLAGCTSTLKVGSLVLCDSFRHPAMLAREAVTLDHASSSASAGARSPPSWPRSASARPSPRTGSAA